MGAKGGGGMGTVPPSNLEGNLGQKRANIAEVWPWWPGEEESGTIGSCVKKKTVGSLS